MIARLSGAALVVGVAIGCAVAMFAPAASAAAITVTGTADIVADDGQCTLREAIIAANTDTASGATSGECSAGSADDTIILAASTYSLTSTLPTITTPMDLVGTDASTTTIDGAGSGTNLLVEAGGDLGITDLTLTGGAGVTGGAIFNELGAVRVSDSMFRSNNAHRGAGILSFSGTVTIDGSVFQDNSVSLSGAAVYSANGTLSISDSVFEGNWSGATVHSTNSTVTISDSVIRVNDGTGASLIGGSATVDRSTISGNSRSGLSASGATVVNESKIQDNAANGLVNTGTLTVNKSTISDNGDGNSAGFSGKARNGGGLYNSGTTTLNESTVSRNEATTSGGGIANFGTMTINGSTISGNDADGRDLGGGGGIHNGRSDILTVVFSTVTDNDAPRGSGILASNQHGFGLGSVSLSASIVADNSGGAADLAVTAVNGPQDPFVTGSFNVIGTTEPQVVAFGGATGDVVGVGGLGLAPLALNGGTTRTHALADGSIPVDLVTGPITIGVDANLDQRGIVRPQGAAKDAGAFEGVGLASAPRCNDQLVTINMNLNGGLGVGTAGDDVILGTEIGDRINGLEGDDTICAAGGPDDVFGGPGADTIFGDVGGDTIRGGGGADMIDGGDGPDTIRGQGGSDVILGGAGPDTLDGQGAADTIDGGAGADMINGQNGADAISGGAGHDDIKGQTGPDVLRGDPGDDTLTGGIGNDTLYGGSGFDKCAGNTGPSDQAEAATCEQTPGVEILF